MGASVYSSREGHRKKVNLLVVFPSLPPCLFFVVYSNQFSPTPPRLWTRLSRNLTLESSGLVKRRPLGIDYYLGRQPAWKNSISGWGEILPSNRLGCAAGWGCIFTTGLTTMGLHFQQS